MLCDELLLRQLDYNKHAILAGDSNIDVLNETMYEFFKCLNTVSCFGLENVIPDDTREEYYGEHRHQVMY